MKLHSKDSDFPILLWIYIYHIYIYKRVRPLTHSIIQNGPGDSMEDWVTNFGVLIGFEALTPTKTGFFEILPPSPPEGGRSPKHIFEHNLAPNFLTMTKLHIGQLDLNTKKSFLAIFEFSISNSTKEGKR